ncbi:MAG: hypothetical protein AAF902_00295 [Chloroflexota bacterium]
MLTFVMFVSLLQFFTVSASERNNIEPEPSPTPVCKYNSQQGNGGEIVYFPDNNECLEKPLTNPGADDRVPTAIKLVSINTQSHDFVSTVGISFTFFGLILLTAFWMFVIRKWNKVDGE